MKKLVAILFIGLLTTQLSAQVNSNNPETNKSTMKIKVTSILVQNQNKALEFYSKVLGFQLKRDIPLGKYRWLTVVSGAEPDGVELLLEPVDSEVAKNYQMGLFEAGIPLFQFSVDDVQIEYERLHQLGVEFSMKPSLMGVAKMAVFNDTCGNNIQIVEVL